MSFDRPPSKTTDLRLSTTVGYFELDPNVKRRTSFSSACLNVNNYGCGRSTALLGRIYGCISHPSAFPVKSSDLPPRARDPAGTPHVDGFKVEDNPVLD